MRISRFVLCAISLFFLINAGSALPRFAARMDLKCQSCHIDPNGGGMRNYYGDVMYGREVLPVPAWSQDTTIEEFTTRLSKYVSMGADVTTLFWNRRESRYTSFYQMQGDIYVSASVARSLLIYFDKALYGGFDVFGFINGLPVNGYLKIGRFTPAYGTRIDDHTTFIRTKTVFPNYRRDDTGIEVGVSPTSFAWNFGIYNGESGADPSNGKIRLMTTWAQYVNQVGNVNYSLGGSLWYNNAVEGSNTMYGGFGALSYKRFVLNGEVDFKTDWAGLRTDEFISYLELNYLIIDGLDLKFIYDFYDPDIHLKSGSETRYSVGAEFFPIQGIELRPLYRLDVKTPDDIRQHEFDFLIHFFL
jgi:hypothetical protein